MIRRLYLRKLLCLMMLTVKYTRPYNLYKAGELGYCKPQITVDIEMPGHQFHNMTII
jgi:hypothetical protein